jgi:hypothetical protein
MGSATKLLMPPKQRMQALMEELTRLEARALRSTPIEVFRVARCGHEACGCQLPAELPIDALVIELGCQYQIPSIDPPEGLEGGYRSRVERSIDHGVGRGLGPERVKATIRMISRLQLLNK